MGPQTLLQFRVTNLSFLQNGKESDETVEESTPAR